MINTRDWRESLESEGSPTSLPDDFSSPGLTQTDESSCYLTSVPAEALPLFLAQGAYTVLPLVEACDNYELPSGPFSAEMPKLKDDIVPFYLSSEDRRQPIGFLLPEVLAAILEDNESMERMHMSPCWQTLTRKDTSIWAVTVAQWLLEEGHAGLTEHFDRLVRGWRQNGKFSSELDGWRDEGYTIYGPAPVEAVSPLPGNNIAFTIERSAASLFSFVTFGVHMTGYCVDPVNEQMSIWVPRRSRTKQTFPGMLDQTVAGGITAGLTPFETLVKECGEEASLSPEFVEKHARGAGLISYVRRGEGGFISPEVQYCYDLRFPVAGPRPRPNDTEVENFMLMTDREALDAILRGEFKPNCALVLLDFLIRHGRITAESDTRFYELNVRLRRRLPLPAPV